MSRSGRFSGVKELLPGAKENKDIYFPVKALISLIGWQLMPGSMQVGASVPKAVTYPSAVMRPLIGLVSKPARLSQAMGISPCSSWMRVVELLYLHPAIAV